VIVLPGGSCHYEAVSKLKVHILQLALQHHTLLMTSVSVRPENSWCKYSVKLWFEDFVLWYDASLDDHFLILLNLRCVKMKALWSFKILELLT